MPHLGGVRPLGWFRWSEVVRDAGEWLEELNDGVMPSPRSAFAFEAVYGATLDQGQAAFTVGRWIEEPRSAAVQRLDQHCARLESLLEEVGLEHDPGSPSGHIEEITGSDPLAFRRLARAVRERTGGHVQIRRNDALVRRCILLAEA